MTKILTTHVGSLPRSQRTVDFVFARERGEPFDRDAFATCMAGECAATVAKQVAAGIDIVSDGETSKISYATYVKDRYTGFSGDGPRNAPADLKLFPSFLERLAKEGGTPQYARPSCTGPVAATDNTDLQTDIANLKAGMAAHGAAHGFMNAASPGVISLFLPNQYYPSREAYLEALAEAMKPEYEDVSFGRSAIREASTSCAVLIFASPSTWPHMEFEPSRMNSMLVSAKPGLGTAKAIAVAAAVIVRRFRTGIFCLPVCSRKERPDA